MQSTELYLLPKIQVLLLPSFGLFCGSDVDVCNWLAEHLLSLFLLGTIIFMGRVMHPEVMNTSAHDFEEL